MRISMDARPAGKDVTGIGRIVLELASRIAKKGNQVDLLYSSTPNFQLLEPNITSTVLNSSARFWWEQVSLPKYLKDKKPDLHHAFWNYGLPLFMDYPFVLTVHDVIPKAWSGYYRSWKDRLKNQVQYELGMRVSLFRAKKILVDSHHTFNDLTKFYPFASSKTELCYPGVDHSINVNNEKTVHWNPTAQPYFIYLGGMDPRKNIALLIRALGVLRGKYKVRLVIVGRYSGEFDELVADLSLTKEVLFPGYLDQESLQKALSESVALVYPSSYEGFGFPILEAQKFTTAVITANNSCLGEIAGHGVLLFDHISEKEIAESMEQVLTDRKLREKIVDLGSKNVKKFTWDKTTRQIENIYQEVKW